jgi:hypothetical protein
MDTAWVGVVGALGGVIVGAFAQARIAAATFKREKFWALTDEKRARLENVWEALDRVRQSYFESYQEFSRLIDASEPVLPRISANADWAHLRMLVFLYLPGLIPDLDAAQDAGLRLGQEYVRVTSASFARFLKKGETLTILAERPEDFEVDLAHTVKGALEAPPRKQDLHRALDDRKADLNQAIDAMRDRVRTTAETLEAERQKAVR